MYNGYPILVIIPALNEAENLPEVIESMPAFVDQVVVADNCSTDGTDEIAKGLGALVSYAESRGYGAACLAAMKLLSNWEKAIVVFVSGDGSDDASEMSGLIAPIANGECKLVIGSRRLGYVEPGAMTFAQRFGNLLATALMRLIWNAKFTDLGPYRAIELQTLLSLQMKDRDYGWTVEMQLKALLAGIKYMEVPVSYKRRRRGTPKVAGTLKGTILSGYKILMWIFLFALEYGLRSEKAQYVSAQQAQTESGNGTGQHKECRKPIIKPYSV